MRIVCAWCGKDLGEKEGAGKEKVTHGICQECLAKLEAQKERRTEKETELDEC